MSSTEDRVVAFLNSVDVEAGTDEMTDLAAWQRWVDSSEEYVDLPRQVAGSLRSARELRTYLRAVAEGLPTGTPPTVSLSVDLGHPDGARLIGTSVAARVVSDVATLAAEKRLDRVKICPADDCRWAFYDRSRNHSRHWCKMEVCGNRTKVRNHRTRTASPS